MYKSAVIRNVRYYAEREQTFDTVFFGGGTPSLLYREVAEIVRVLPTVPGAEITVESNPSDINPHMLGVLAESGVNRLSIGVQSLDDSILRSLGRRHDSETAVKAVETAREFGFANISVDVMLGIPGQTKDSLADTVERVVQLPIEHVSAYIYEVKDAEDSAVEDETAAEMYLLTAEGLEKGGFKQYEISNFARIKCRHNLKYWNCEEYIGIGAAAHSYYGGKRFAVAANVEAFVGSPLQEVHSTEEEPGTFEERLMLKLRLTSGVGPADCDCESQWRQLTERAKRVSGRYVTVGSERISLTTEGFLMSNRIIGELIINNE